MQMQTYNHFDCNYELLNVKHWNEIRPILIL